MGMDIKTTIGLYFEIAEEVVTPRYVKGQRCSNPDCERHQDFKRYGLDKFCSGCGSAMEATSQSDGYAVPKAYDFCDAVFSDGDYLTSSLEGLDGRIWLYNSDLACVTKGIGNLTDAIEVGSGSLDLSDIHGPKIIADALAEDPRLADVVPAFYQYFDLPESNPGLITLKFGIVVYVA